MKVLCFSPNDAVWVWARPQAQVLKTFLDRGDEVLYVHCDRALTDFCMSMASTGVKFTDDAQKKNEVCERCVSQSSLVRDHLGCSGHALHLFIEKADIEAAEKLASADFETLRSFTLSGVPIGMFSHYEALIQTQSLGPNISAAAQDLYRIIVRNAFIVVKATERMIAQLKPDIGITYHSAYTYNRSFMHLLEQNKIPVWSLNASLSMAELHSHLLVSRSEMIYKKAMDDWNSYFCNIPASKDEHIAVADHILSLMSGGGYAYSTALQRRAPALGESSSGVKNISAILSSYDELWASELAGFDLPATSKVFRTQVDWVRWLFEFARRREDIRLTVRVHPREFVFSAEGRQSEHATLLQSLFKEKPDNVTINLPEDRISMYEILFESDVVLVAWSSAGVEAGLLGIPVVTYFPEAVQFPHSLTYLASNADQYEGKIDEALRSGWSLERSRLFFRWAALLLIKTRMQLWAGEDSSRGKGRFYHFCQRVLRYVGRRFDPLFAERASLRSGSASADVTKTLLEMVEQRKEMIQDLESRRLATTGDVEEQKSVVTQLHRLLGRFSSASGRVPDRMRQLLEGHQS